MAQKRMLNKSISLSKQVNFCLSVKSQLLYTWSIPHLDDWGYITKDVDIFKATVVPLSKHIDELDIKKFFQEASVCFDEYGVALIEERSDCYFFTGFGTHQTISEEKKAKTKFEAKKVEKPQEPPKIPKKAQKSPAQYKIIKAKGIKEKSISHTALKARKKIKVPFLSVTDGKILNETMHLFKEVNPSSYLLYKNTNQRKALDRMCHKHGIPKMQEIIKSLPALNEKKYCVTVTTPIQLEENLGKLWFYIKKQSDSGKGKSFIT